MNEWSLVHEKLIAIVTKYIQQSIGPASTSAVPFTFIGCLPVVDLEYLHTTCNC